MVRCIGRFFTPHFESFKRSTLRRRLHCEKNWRRPRDPRGCYFGCLKRASKPVQELLNDIDADNFENFEIASPDSGRRARSVVCKALGIREQIQPPPTAAEIAHFVEQPCLRANLQVALALPTLWHLRIRGLAM